MYKAILPGEFLDNAWNSADKKTKSPNVTKITEHFNLISRWVSLSLLTTDTKSRTNVLKVFLKMAVECQILNNFHGMFAILGGFSASSVHRLNIKLSNEKAKILESLKAITSPASSWRDYRTVLHKTNPPCIPFVGVYQTDLTFIEEGNPKYLNGLINFKKCMLVATTIQEIQQYQQQPYNLATVPVVRDFIIQGTKLAEATDNNALYDLSLKLSPRESTME